MGKEWFNVEPQRTFGSFKSVPIFVHIIVILRRLDQCKNIYWKFIKCVLEISWKSPGNLLGWICRHRVIVSGEPAVIVKSAPVLFDRLPREQRNIQCHRDAVQ